MANHTTRAQRINARYEKIWEKAAALKRLGSPQSDFPGTAPDMAGLLRKLASERLKPKSAQLPCDIGIFSDEAAQIDLIEMLQDPVAE